MTTVNSYGWDYYVIWVGPQSACASGGPYATYISNNTTTAFNQGTQEALAAISAASNLGMYGRHAYYYDLEAYSTTNTTCRNAAKAFVSGWSYEIRVVMTEKAGVYGSPCNAVDWATVQYVPDAVYLAQWTNDPDVWGLSCLSNNLWRNEQRLHQYQKYPYTLPHNETYGSVTLYIDNDCAMGPVVPNGHGGTEDGDCTIE